MRIRRAALGAAGSAVAGMLAVVGLPAAPALADTGVTLPITHYAQMVVAGGHVFISQGAGSSSILVTDLDGNTVGTVPGQTGATGLAVSPDGRTVYAALTGDDSISAIDAATLAQSADYPTGAGTAPAYLAVAGGKIWFGYGPDNTWQGGIGSLDLSGAAPVVALAQTPAQDLWYGAPMVVAGPPDSDLIVAGDTDQEPPYLRDYDVSSGSPAQVASLAGGGDYGSLADMAVTSDGKDVVLATGYPYDEQALSTAALTPDGQYASAAYPDAVAVAPDGTVAVGEDGTTQPSLSVYAEGGSAALGSYSPGTLAAHGLAWSPDSGTLFAVTDTYDDNAGESGYTYTLNVIPNPALAASRLTLDGPATDVPGRQLTVQGTLSSTSALPAGATVTVTRTDPADPDGVALPAATVAADGSFSVTDTPQTPGTYSYRADYAGDAGHTGAEAAVTVAVAYPAAVPVLTAPATDTRGKALRITGRLPDGPYPAGAGVQITRTDLAHPQGVALPRAAVAADGSFAFTDTPQIGGANTYRVGYAGDATHTGGSASATVQVSRAATSIGTTLNTGNRTYAYNAWAGITVHLGATYNSRTVSVYAQPVGGARTLVTSGTVDSHGNLTGWYRITRNTVFTASFAGDDRYAPAGSAKLLGWSHAYVAEALAGSYTTVKQSGIEWKVFHQAVSPAFAAAVAPNKSGECTALTLQEYSGSAWHNLATDRCAVLNASSVASARATLKNAVGHEFRIIAEYVHSAADNQNVDTYGAWQYFQVRA